MPMSRDAANWRSRRWDRARTLEIGGTPDPRARDRRGTADRVRPRRAGQRQPVAQGRPAARGHTRVTLDLPLGSHLEPQGDGADLSRARARRT